MSTSETNHSALRLQNQQTCSRKYANDISDEVGEHHYDGL
jgi:hypothetical protein